MAGYLISLCVFLETVKIRLITLMVSSLTNVHRKFEIIK
jgi:hypothetical protein